MKELFKRSGKCCPITLLIFLVLLGNPPKVVAAEETSNINNFTENVLPILRQNCFRCHGEKNQEANLRLDVSSAVFASADSGEPIVVPENPAASLLVHRIVGDSHGEQMPPDAPPLSRADLETLRRWIQHGADWPDDGAATEHWAYQPITKPTPPTATTTSDTFPPASPIDAFVQHRLRNKSVSPAPRATPERLLRRASLVLTGLPPSLAQLDAFLADPSPLAYERAIDRMLASEQFGQRWATPWLDLARYADSNGFQADQIRDNWAYRDWLIRALNSDMPFDQFTIEQLAGDLLPAATLDQKIATGFHRMTTCNVEAGVHPEANRVNQVVDRVNTTATVFLGTTLECAQCHDHKYDPFSQEDYYKFFAYFNNTPLEVKQTEGVTWDFYGPTMDLPLSESQLEMQTRLRAEIAELEAILETDTEKLDASFHGWLQDMQDTDATTLTWQPAVPESFQSSGKESFQIQDDGAVLISGSVPENAVYTLTFPLPEKPITGIRLEALTDPSIPGNGPGRGDPQRSNFVLHELTCQLIDGDTLTDLKLQNPEADISQNGWDVAGAIDGDSKTGWAIGPQFGKPHWATFQLQQPIVDASTAVRLRIKLDQHFGQGRVIGKPRVSFFSADANLLPLASLIDQSPSLRKALAAGRLDGKQKKQLRKIFDHLDPQRQQQREQLTELKKQLAAIKPETTLVMEELAEPRETFVMLRGEYEQLGQQVQPAPPSALPYLKQQQKNGGTRLELARWLVSSDNPLVARVTVNRWWSQIFGAGLVTTPEDFGTQSEPPSHPQLLDWLASELIQSGWSMKHVIREIVLSDTFCQQSNCTPDTLEKDPANRWLARGPRYRLTAETIRDNALAVSGMLSTKMYGPPVMPHQPANLWRSVGRNQPKWIAAENEDRFRRGLYVVFKRASPYPSFINFDTPDRGSCTVQRATTNTPLQALTLMNDPAYAELALAFADRLLSIPAESDKQRLQLAMKIVVSRVAEPKELEVLQEVLDAERQLLVKEPDLISQRTSPKTNAIRIAAADKAELAAWFTIASVLLNLDETINL